MNQNIGKLIVLDGTDGSGKGTQHSLLAKRLQQAAVKLETIDFPQYGGKSAGPIEEYLNGKYGEFEDVSPYVSSMFYTVDRFASKKRINHWLQEKKLILANRYVSSNMGHQGAHFPNVESRKQYWDWLLHQEYEVFGIPRPYKTYILFVPVEISQKLVLEKSQRSYLGNKKQDIHEKNKNHLMAAQEAFVQMSEAYKDIELVDCTKDGLLLEKAAINDILYSKIQADLKE